MTKADLGGNVRPHLAEAPMTQTDAVARAGLHVDDAPERLGTAHDPSHAGDRRYRRVIRVQGETHPRSLGHGYDRLEQVREIAPHLLISHRPAVALGNETRVDSRSTRHQRQVADVVVVECRGRGAAAPGSVAAGSIDPQGVHVVHQHVDPCRADVAHRRRHALELLVAARQAKLPFVGPRPRQQPDAIELEIERLYVPPQILEEFQLVVTEVA